MLLQFAVLRSRLARTAHNKEKTSNRRKSSRKRCTMGLPPQRHIRQDIRRALERVRSILQWRLTTGSRVLTTGRRGLAANRRRKRYHQQKGKRAQTSNAAYQPQKAKKNQTQAGRQTAKAANERQTVKTPPSRVPRVEPGNVSQVKGAGKPNQAKTATTAGQNAAKGKFAQGKPVKTQHFNLSKQPNTAKAPAVKFQQGRHIQGSQNWHGQQYTVFRNYNSQWHNQNWWHNHYHNNIVFVFGAPYYWNAGYWFPAWGYYPNAYYAWDGPVYGYNHLPPDQVIANVQATLQQQGYYQGEVDGLIGPLTRGAIADYQRDHDLYITSAIDQPTLQSLGMT